MYLFLYPLLNLLTKSRQTKLMVMLNSRKRIIEKIFFQEVERFLFFLYSVVSILICIHKNNANCCRTETDRNVGWVEKQYNLWEIERKGKLLKISNLIWLVEESKTLSTWIIFIRMTPLAFNCLFCQPWP